MMVIVDGTLVVIVMRVLLVMVMVLDVFVVATGRRNSLKGREEGETGEYS